MSGVVVTVLTVATGMVLIFVVFPFLLGLGLGLGLDPIGWLFGVLDGIADFGERLGRKRRG